MGKEPGHRLDRNIQQMDQGFDSFFLDLAILPEAADEIEILWAAHE